MSESGGGLAREHYSGRSLLGVAALPPPVSASAGSAPSLHAQRARVERALGVTTAVLFAASLSYIALSAIYGCFCAGRAAQQQPDAEPGAPQAAAEKTKRALEEIPVVVIQVGDGGGRDSEGVVQEEAGECAVCLVEYAGGEEVRVLPACRHGFHRECVDRWLLTRAPTCPVCRAPVAAARSEGHDAKDCATGDAAVLPVDAAGVNDTTIV